MNLLLRISLISAFGAVAQTFLPWWSSVVIALAVELVLGKGNATAFFSGFYGIAIPWMIMATYIDIKSESVLSVRILELFKLPQYPVVMIVLTGLLGGLAAGVGSMTGGWIKNAITGKDGE
ncbi:MAG: hypothetical protein ACI9UR_002803 [Bacteroidia bacterium]|jgi:hypothetical protein